MADDEAFAKAVEDGLKLAKRVYAGKDQRFAPPVPVPLPVAGMERSPESPFLPAAPMVYAVIADPAIVDNPDIPSYQPHVHGRCDPPVLIPLHMTDIAVEVDCILDSAFVAVRGRWRVHCVMRTRSCDCRLVVPMGEQVKGNLALIYPAIGDSIEALIAPYVFYVDLIEKHMARWFHRALSTMLANITIDIFNDLDEVEVCSGTVSS
ncbi:hypothetical protein BHE74_00049210 [Ensete ventricosum]|nr:hypothetical protein BHE74_00049210 [Ensete ventricosum]